MPPESYALLDSGHGRKIERFGPFVLARPCAQAIWLPRLSAAEWERADAQFDREDGNRWQNRSALPERWTIVVDGLHFVLSGTDFGHLGIFPEQRDLWQWIGRQVRRARRPHPAVLNLFAYSGGSTLAAARAGAEVCHVDASQGMVNWARENAAANGLQEHPIRWIVDDVHKFLGREVRRGRRYDAVILDPPTFGRGKHGEVYKIEQDLPQTLDLCRQLLSDAPLFLLLSAHTPGISAQVLQNLLAQAAPSGQGALENGEMMLRGESGVLPVPSGCYARWSAGESDARRPD